MLTKKKATHLFLSKKSEEYDAESESIKTRHMRYVSVHVNLHKKSLFYMSLL